jgi:dTDP-4-dehydrorhamnose reductase
MDPMNLFIFGAGYTANQFIKCYRSRFTRVSGTFRSPWKAASLQATGIIPYAFNGASYDARILEELARTDVLLLSIPPHSGSDPVLKQFGREIASARRLSWAGYLSTVGVYGNTSGEWVDENSPPSPLNERSRDRQAAELQWLDLGKRAHCAVQVFRLAGIYGPGRNALLRVAEGTARRIIKPGQVFNRIHTSDIAQVLMASIERPSRNTIYNVADDEPGPPQDVITYAAELLGRDPPPLVSFTEADLGSMAQSFYRDNKRVRNTRIKEELGVTLRYPNYRLGLDALLASGEGVRAPLKSGNVTQEG